MDIKDIKIVIKGAGEMASGIAHRLYMSNFKKILMTEIEKPISVRRFVAFSEAVYEKAWTVEGVTGELISDVDELERLWNIGKIGIMIDPKWSVISKLKPRIVIDAIMAKKNIGTKKDEADIVIGVGPGFNAPDDCHAVIESNRGHYLGRVIYKGSSEPHTGIPGPVMGLTKERVLRSEKAGNIRHVKCLGDEVKKGDIIMYIDDAPVVATIDGILRGQIREIYVTENEKIGDIDPRGKKEYCFTISEKARAIAGGVLEAIMHFLYKEGFHEYL